MRTLFASLFTLALIALASGCRRPSGAHGEDAGTPSLPVKGPQGTVTVKGSDTMVILGQRWAEQYMKEHPGAKIQVTGGGSGTGIASLINGTTDIAMSSRPIKDTEKQQVRQRHPEGPVEITVAKDGVTFYVHETNPVEALSIPQLESIYLGDITNWKDVGGKDAPIIVYSRENSSGTYAFVKDEVLGGEDFTVRALTLPGTAAVVHSISQEKNGIGYGGAAFAKGIKELKVSRDAQGEAIAPTEQNIQNGTYPLSRGLYFYLPGKASGVAKSFIDYALSPEGQQIVTQTGYFPVK
ncbi:phosphate ABC transporter substrate-binding protein [Archangium violaceum]|uniref:phosphate ABC transporter substrate-binding protein n=1 Tax=Archangium violaceum TaxID=83451 RepID=UPI00193C44DB|nr:phosphate ABC transporter substrate-binding protein [Archangium violaceum]QRK04613.1 phosphate ABC transporter substrate-binding protein [Archangium violaceum]